MNTYNIFSTVTDSAPAGAGQNAAATEFARSGNGDEDHNRAQDSGVHGTAWSAASVVKVLDDGSAMVMGRTNEGEAIKLYERNAAGMAPNRGKCTPGCMNSRVLPRSQKLII